MLRGRRVVVIDAGTHSVKLLLVRESLGGLRVLVRECMDLRQEGLLSPEDFSHHLRRRLQELDYDQVALVLPQHLSISQIIDLPSNEDSPVSGLIEEEIVKLSGLSESAIVYHYIPIRPFASYQNPFWVTLCRERDVLLQTDRLALGQGDVCEITPTGSAMIATFQSDPALPQNALLLNIGAENTVAVIVLEGQGVSASTFPIGGNMFTEALAADLDRPMEEAEEIKRSRELFGSLETHPRFRAGFEDWCAHTRRTLQEWIDDPRFARVDRGEFTILVCGGGAAQPGLIGELPKRIGLPTLLWKGGGGPAAIESDASQFIVAHGAALQVFGSGTHSASLMPASFREAHHRYRSLERLQAAGLLLMLLTGIVLSLGIWHKLKVVDQKDQLLLQAYSSLTQIGSAEKVLTDLTLDYQQLRPILERQKSSWETLRTLSWLQRARSNQNFWYLLFADQKTYFESQPPGETNPPAISGDGLAVFENSVRTNQWSTRPMFIAELCIPEAGTNTLLSLSQVVTNLRSVPLFRNVDTLSPGLRRELVDPKLRLPNRHFVLTMELPENEFQRPVIYPPQPLLPSPGLSKPVARTFQQKVDLEGRP